jgi:hypothetical protein
VLLAMSLPFVWVGTALTLRRLHDIGWPPWRVILFFAPFLNLLFFAFLCVTPGADQRLHVDLSAEPPRGFRWLRARDRAAAGGLAVGVALAFALPLVFFCATILTHYGWGLFVGVPFIVGVFTTLIYSAGAPRTLGECLGISLAACLACGVALMLFAMEGFICILMVMPIAGALTMLGAVAGYTIQRARWSIVGTTRMYAATWVCLPLLMTAEAQRASPPALHAVTTVCEIDAPPATVWAHVVEFAELPPPQEMIFHSGIAYPVRARIAGRGVGAVRRCEFSTGPFVEPITAWEEPRRLAFDVTSQPEPMRELSPYRAIHPPHLDGFFRSRRGEFRLVELPGARTRLEGTTWYEQKFWPGRYWQFWSDYLVHRIHARVLAHIKVEAETATTK